MPILDTIIPIFTVIFLGWLARRHGFIPPAFAGPANRLVFYFAIPAMVFAAIAKGSLKTDISYVMAVEMNGDADFAVTAISLSTLVSALTFSLWLHVI